MKPETLATIKKDMSKFLKVYDALCDYWNRDKNGGITYPDAVTASVLLQNAAFSGVNCFEYDHDNAVDTLHEIHNCLRIMAEYHKDYMIEYAFRELDCSITAHTMSEEPDIDCSGYDREGNNHYQPRKPHNL